MKNDKLFELFKTETDAYINTMENSLLELQPDSPDNKLINEIYRSAHTIKGSASILQCDIIKELMHPVETILQSITDTEVYLSDELIDVLLHVCDLIKMILHDLPKTEKYKKQKSMLCLNLKKYINKQKKETKKPKKTLYRNNAETTSKYLHDYIVFSSAETLFAIPLFLVKEVLNDIKIKPIPNIEDCLLGISNWCGKIVPIIDFKKRFDLRKGDSSEHSFIVLNLRESFLGIKIDSLYDIIDSTEKIVWSPQTDLNLWSFCDAYYRRKEAIIHLINTEILFSKKTLEVN